MRVLIVEHNPQVNEPLVGVLHEHGADITRIGNGEDALDVLGYDDFDGIIVDMALVDMEGYEFIRRARVKHAATPILALSDVSRPQARIRAFAVGADDFLLRPLDENQIIARLQIHATRPRLKS